MIRLCIGDLGWTKAESDEFIEVNTGAGLGVTLSDAFESRWVNSVLVDHACMLLPGSYPGHAVRASRMTQKVNQT